jgi:hypothetical protein
MTHLGVSYKRQNRVQFSGSSTIGLLSPTHNVTLPLPITFTWQRRAVATDTYRFYLWDPNSGQSWRSPNDLGYVGAETVTELP